MKKKLFAVLATLALLVVGITVKAQAPPEQHTFTLSWELNRNIDSTFGVHSLLTLDSQPAPSSTCGQSSGGYNIWCGEVFHYASGLYDFNFSDTQLLSDCSLVSSSSHTVYTAVNRRTVTETDSFSCGGWSVVTTTTTNQYRSAQRYFYYWYNFPAGQQPAIQGTLTAQ